MHTGAKDTQATFATKSIITSEHDDSVWPDKGFDDQLSKQPPEMVDIPDSLAEETVIVREVPIANRITGDNQIGDIAMSDRESPSGHQ